MMFATTRISFKYFSDLDKLREFVYEDSLSFVLSYYLESPNEP